MSEPTQYMGFRGVVPPIPDLLQHVGTLTDVEVQLLRADRVYGVDHLRSAVLHADRAFTRGVEVASVWPLEVLRYAAGERQINRALTFLGLTEGEATVAAVVRGDAAPFAALAADLGWVRDDGVLEGGAAVLEAWTVPAPMRDALPPERWDDLVLERVALADLR